MTSTTKGGLDRKIMTPLFIILAIDMIGAGVVLPLLPFYALRFGADALTIGLLVASFSFCQALAAPLIGRWSDRYGRRKMLAISQFGTMVSLVMLAAANSLSMIFLARIVGGLTAGNMSVASAMAVDHSTPATRKQAIGIISAGVGVGLMSGPALSTLFAGTSLSAPIWIACVLSGLGVIATLVLLRKDSIHHADFETAKAGSAALDPSDVLPVLVVLAAFFLAFAMYTSQFAVVAHARVTWQGHPLGPREIGLAFTISGAINILIQILAMRKVAACLSDRALSVASLAALAIGFGLLGSASPLAIGTGVIIAAFGSALARPALISTLTIAGRPGQQAMLLGITSSLMAAASVIGPIFAGALIDRAQVGLWSAAMSLLCVAAALIVLTRVGRRAWC